MGTTIGNDAARRATAEEAARRAAAEAARKAAEEAAQKAAPTAAKACNPALHSADCFEKSSRPVTAAQASTLLQEDSHDGRVNCLDRAADWVERATPALLARSEMVFLKDGRGGAEGATGHVIIRQGERVLDPTTGKSYENLKTYLKEKPYYSPMGTLSGTAAAKVFGAAPGSPERRKALADAKVPASLQRAMLADSPRNAPQAPHTSTPSAARPSAGNPSAGNPSAAAPPAAQAPKPTYTQEQADADAKALYDATDGGLTGWGTDEDKIWKTLEGKTPEQIDQIRKSYEEHYGKDLDKKLRDETSGKDRERVDALLKGKDNQSEADAVKIQAELESTFNVDEQEILKTIEKASPQDRHKLAEAYAKKYGGPADKSPEDFLLSKLKGSFNEEEMKRAQSLLAVSSAKTPEEAMKLEADAAAGRLKVAVDGMGTDEDTIKEVLGGKSKEQVAAIEKAYQEKYGESLRDRLVSEAGGDSEKDVFLRLLNPAAEGDVKAKAEASAERLKLAVDGMGTDEEAIRRELEGKSREELDAIQAAYKEKYGQELKDRLIDEAGGQGEKDTWLRMLDPPEEGDKVAQAAASAERLRQAVDGMGTDEDAIRKELSAKSKAEIDAIAAAYQQKYGEDLRQRLDDELGGRDQVELLEQMFDKGAIDPNDPNAAQERLRRVREQQEGEKGFGLWLTSGVQKLTKGESDEDRLKANLDAAQAAIDSGDRERAKRLAGFAQGDLESEQAAKDKAADYAAEGAAVVASTAVVIGTAGTAAPAVAAAWAGAAGAAASAGAYAAVQGGAADSADIAKKGVLGGVTGATAVVGGGAAASAIGKRAVITAGKEVVATAGKEAAVTAGREATEAAGKTVARRSMAAAAKEGAKDGAKAGAAQGAAYSGADTAMSRDTWEDGFVTGLGKVGLSALEGGASGAVFGAATGAAMGPGMEALGRAKTKLTQPREVAVVDNPNLHGRTTLVRYDKGRVHIQKGPLATAADVQAHMETARVLQKYEGPLGKIRQLRDRIDQAIRGRPGHGSQGFESQLEVKKLSGIRADLERTQLRIENRIRKMGDKPDAATVAERAAIERDIANIDRQLATHEAQVGSLEAARGYVAALDKAPKELRSALDNLSVEARKGFDHLPPELWTQLKRASGEDLQRLGAMLAKDPGLGRRLAGKPAILSALKTIQGNQSIDLERALFRQRMIQAGVKGGNLQRISQAVERSGLSGDDLSRLSRGDLEALGRADAALARARESVSPNDPKLEEIRIAEREFSAVDGALRDKLRASISHTHGVSDVKFLLDPAAALRAKFPAIPDASLASLARQHPDALRALELASEGDIRRIIRWLDTGNPKDVEDILRSYMYKAQKAARKSRAELRPPTYAAGRLEESLANLAEVRSRGYPFGFSDKAQYQAFVAKMEEELAARGIKGKVKVQGSAMHSKTPNDIDVEILVDRAEFDRLARRFRANAPPGKIGTNLERSIEKGKVPSFQFYPDNNPSVAGMVTELTQGPNGKLDVQATLIVEGSNFDLGPSLSIVEK